MKTVVAHLKGVSPYSQSKPIVSGKETGEAHDDFEKRTWKERIHSDQSGEVFVPAPAIKLCLYDCAKYLSESVPGKGKATYTKHFEAGVMVVANGMLGINKADVQHEWLFVPSDGKKGGAKRVWKCFPIIPEWECDVEIILLDPILIAKPEKVREYLEHSGKFIGLGRYRPRNGGTYGRFVVESFK